MTPCLVQGSQDARLIHGDPRREGGTATPALPHPSDPSRPGQSPAVDMPGMGWQSCTHRCLLFLMGGQQGQWELGDWWEEGAAQQ